MQDPFRRGLGHAVQWYDCLRNHAEKLRDRALDDCVQRVQAALSEQTSDVHMGKPYAWPSIIYLSLTSSLPRESRLD